MKPLFNIFRSWERTKWKTLEALQTFPLFLCKIEYSKSNFRMDSIATTVYILDDDGILYGLIFFFSAFFFFWENMHVSNLVHNFAIQIHGQGIKLWPLITSLEMIRQKYVILVSILPSLLISLISSVSVKKHKMARTLTKIQNSLWLRAPKSFSLPIAAFHKSYQRPLEAEPHLIRSKFPDVPLSKKSFGDFLWANANKYGQRTSLVS